jgi:His-Xaa-Ser system radical SAM maturase HxsC
MIQLKTRGIARNITDTVVAKIVSGNGIMLNCFSSELDESVYLSKDKNEVTQTKGIFDIPDIEHLDIGDIVLINPNGTVYTLFRVKSPHNALFITDRCNSNCLMCSQPPRNVDDLDYYFNINSQLVKLIPKSTQELGITGGEPTLLGERFITLLNLITENLPDTDIHVLTNGRSFAYKNIPEKLSRVNNRKVVYGIPLYSDYYQSHDYVVQAKDAFNQTVLGLHNLARNYQRIEIRIVLHKQTYKRLTSLAKFIYMNLPFVEHIAFMGLEYTGYTPRNSDLLWMEPSEYSSELEEAVNYLNSMDMNVSIYNLQLCLLKPTLWKFARKSISDWKREYLDECNNCNLLKECGGVFATSKKHSNEIKAILS